MNAKRGGVELAVAMLLLIAGAGYSQQRENFRIQKINDHVYAFIGSDPLLDWVDGNSYAILTDEGVFVVDTHQPPVAAEENIAEIRKLTDKPVKYILNTHWHGDHNTGNAIYRKTFPEVQIISQARTREILLRRMPDWTEKARAGEYDDYLKMYDTLLLKGKGLSGKPLTEFDRTHILQSRAIVSKYAQDVRREEACFPNVTFDHAMTIYLGGREIQIRHARANTPGDAYVWLPQDSALITGDIVVSPIPYCFGSFFQDWVVSLDSMLALRPRLVLPGHGEIMTDTVYMRTIRDLFASLVTQARNALATGITSDDSVKAAIDLSAFRAKLTGNSPAKDWAFRNFLVGPAIPRVLKELRDEIGDDLEDN